MSAAAHNLGELKDALRADAAGVAETLLGPPNKHLGTKRSLRWGAKGSLSLAITGAKKGVWYSHEEGRGGDLLGLIRHVRGCSEDDALRWASDKTGIQINIPDGGESAEARQRRAQQEADRRTRQAERDAKEVEEAASEQAHKINVAQRIAAATVPAFGTSAAFYLEFTRGIPPGPDGWPDAIRFHPGHHALVAIATDASGVVRAVQRIHLTKQDTKIDQAEVERRNLPAVKATNGTMAGVAVRLPGPADGPLLLCEGPETGLTAWSCTHHEVWVALGGIANLTPPAGRQVVVCRDDDKRHTPADKKLSRTVAEWRRAGIKVAVAKPWEVRRGDGSDLADVILADGVEAVRRRIDAVLVSSRTLAKRVPVKEARRQVAEASRNFFGRVDRLSVEKVERDSQAAAQPPVMDCMDWDAVLSVSAPVSQLVSFTWGIRLSVGVGKSSQARADAVSTLVAMRTRGDMRNIVLAVPFHVLGDEQAADFRTMFKGPAAGLRVAIWRGRDTPNPAYPEYRNVHLERDQKPT